MALICQNLGPNTEIKVVWYHISKWPLSFSLNLFQIAKSSSWLMSIMEAMCLQKWPHNVRNLLRQFIFHGSNINDLASKKDQNIAD